MILQKNANYIIILSYETNLLINKIINKPIKRKDELFMAIKELVDLGYDLETLKIISEYYKTSDMIQYNNVFSNKIKEIYTLLRTSRLTHEAIIRISREYPELYMLSVDELYQTLRQMLRSLKDQELVAKAITDDPQLLGLTKEISKEK